MLHFTQNSDEIHLHPTGTEILAAVISLLS